MKTGSRTLERLVSDWSHGRSDTTARATIVKRKPEVDLVSRRRIVIPGLGYVLAGLDSRLYRGGEYVWREGQTRTGEERCVRDSNSEAHFRWRISFYQPF